MSEDAFLGFRTLITTTIVKILYVVGCLAVTVGGMVWMAGAVLASDGRPALHFIGGALTITVGNLLWRLVCEGWILFFSLHEMLASVEKTLKANTELLEIVSGQLVGIETNTEQRHEEAMRRRHPAGM